MAEFPHQMTRSLLFEFLNGKGGGQYLDVVHGVATLAAEKGIVPCDGPPQHRQALKLLDHTDNWKLHEDIRQLLWQLIVQGVLVPGRDRNNQEWPWFSVTEHGQQVLAAEKPQPYDPDGFIAEFQRKNPDADPVILDYLEEGVRAFNYGCPKSAAVMIGAASEKAILLLHEAFENAITDAKLRKKYQGEAGTTTTIARKYQALRRRLDQMVGKGTLPDREQRFVTDELHGCFQLIKRQRDAAGHPAIVAHHDPDSVFVNLRLMTEHIRGVYALIDFFGSNPAEW